MYIKSYFGKPLLAPDLYFSIPSDFWGRQFSPLAFINRRMPAVSRPSFIYGGMA